MKEDIHLFRERRREKSDFWKEERIPSIGNHLYIFIIF